MLPLAEPLTVSGLSGGIAARLARAGARHPGRRQVLVAPTLPLNPFPAAPPRPGSAMGVGYSSGDLAVGAVGTVAYVDGDRVWGFGHPFENSGLRSLLLQDAYVYTVISNPNAGDDTGSTYKLAAVGHDLGTISNDASAAVVGRTGAPAPTIPVRIFSEDADTGKRDTLAASVVDETDAGTPTGSSALSFVGPLALAQGASEVLRSAPGKLIGSVCFRIAIRERKKPFRVCNRYASALAPSDPEAGANIVAAGGASDALSALTELDDYKPRALHVTEFTAGVTLHRGLHQAFLRSVDLPRKVRAGRRVRARFHLQVVRGPRVTRTARIRIPRSLSRGRHRLTFVGHDVDDPDSDLFGALIDTITIGDEDSGESAGSEGARSLAQLSRRIKRIQRYDGVRLRVGGRRHARLPRPAAADLGAHVESRARPPVGSRHGTHRQAPPLPEHLGQDRRAPLLEGPEGARRAGHRVRDRQGPDPPRQARRAREAERPAQVPGARAARRRDLPRRVGRDGRPHPYGRPGPGRRRRR